MLRKIATLTWKELYTTFTDRSLLLLLIATPLALATIIGLAFGSFYHSGNDIPIRDIPVVVVNQDEGVQVLSMAVNYGQTFEELLIPPDGGMDVADDGTAPAEDILLQLTEAQAWSDADAARAAVDRGDFAAAVVIPPEFSRKLSFNVNQMTIEPTSIEVYASPASPVSGSIIRSIVEGFANQIATGNIAVAATFDYLFDQVAERPGIGLLMLAAFRPDFGPAFDPEVVPLRIEQQTITGEAVQFNPLVYFGAANAVFFMLFAAQSSANGLLVERRDGTLQRLLTTPTPRPVLLLGKLIGTFCMAVVQMILLLFFMTLIGSALAGEIQFIWGRHLGLIGLTIAAAALAASGLGTLITALSRTPEQANVIGGAIIVAMGVFGGTFFDAAAVPALQPLSRLTITYWATDTFTRLALDRVDVGLNLLVLLGLGAAMFFGGLFLFNRRLET